MGKQINNQSDVATEETNIVDTTDPILAIEPDDGTVLIISANVSRGTEPGIPIIADLKDSNGDPLPQDTEMVLQFEGPTDDSEYAVSLRKDSIRAYNTLDIKDQQNEEYVDRIKHELKGRELIVEDTDTFYVSIKSTKQIDWSKSRLTIDENAVAEVSA